MTGVALVTSCTMRSVKHRLIGKFRLRLLVVVGLVGTGTLVSRGKNRLFRVALIGFRFGYTNRVVEWALLVVKLRIARLASVLTGSRKKLPSRSVRSLKNARFTLRWFGLALTWTLLLVGLMPRFATRKSVALLRRGDGKMGYLTFGNRLRYRRNCSAIRIRLVLRDGLALIR